MRAGMDKAAQSLIRISRVYQQHMRSLFVILAHHVVGKE